MKKNLTILNTFFLIFLTIFTISCEDKENEVEPECDGSFELEITSSPTSFEEQEGTLEVQVNGGTPPYQYSINGTNFQNESLFSGLGFGEYTVSVKDSQNCSTTGKIEVKLTAISFSDHVAPLITTSCATNSNCHGAGSNFPIFSSYEEIKAYSNDIKTKTGNKTMPPASSGTLTNEQIQMIADWVDAGAPQN
ncbi:SprB repeat-containing protein [Xanthovirga aplysinae]|uniref:SprB repeat-containing protein n=1 Tax=Xanthovirga aplysinae TaxID=2529853 RepID=UPI0012BC97EF|nr:SprB repeat-containing protein [Xanthovirga aplysinae]MTI31870.1 hypothetical protein [Xanthovirga aplysinae]